MERPFLLCFESTPAEISWDVPITPKKRIHIQIKQEIPNEVVAHRGDAQDFRGVEGDQNPSRPPVA